MRRGGGCGAVRAVEGAVEGATRCGAVEGAARCGAVECALEGATRCYAVVPRCGVV